MASFTAYPTTKTGCFNPIIYNISIIVTGNASPPALELDVRINASSFRTLFIGTYKERTQVGSDYVYIFEVDLSQVIQSYFDNDSFFYDDLTVYPFSDASLTASVALDAYEWQPNSSGVLTRNNSATSSNSRLFFNSLQFDMSDYTAATGRKFMTTRKDYRLSKEFTNLIAVFSDTDNDIMQIETNTSIIFLVLTRDQINIINLNDYFDNTTTFLSVTIGKDIGDEFIATGESILFTFLKDICEPICLHFQNRLGTAENFVFKNYEYEIAQEIEREFFVTAGNNVRMSLGQLDKNITLSRNGFFIEEWVFFRDVATSSVFYIEDSEGNIDEVYPQFSALPFRSRTGEIDMSIDFNYSEELKLYGN